MNIENLIQRYQKIEHYISPASLLTGFVWHLVTLRRIDLLFDNLLVVFYLFVTGLTILYLNACQTGRLRGRFFEIGSVIAPFLLQFSIGGLICSFLIFYGQSSTLVVSWPFLAALVLALIGNEFFRKGYQILTLQICVFFVVVFLYAVFAMPIIFNRIGVWVFLSSGIVSLGVILLFLWLIRRVSPQAIETSRRQLILTVGGAYLALNLLYFTNLIPPIPLSLKEGAIAHSVSQTPSGWVVQVEPKPWYLFYRTNNPVFHWQPGERVYCYAMVFAPTDIKTGIYHRWSVYETKRGKWVETSRVRYDIVGGRDGGYRGYSYKQNVVPGGWRVDVENDRGQVLGRLSFEIVEGKPPALREVVYG